MRTVYAKHLPYTDGHYAKVYQEMLLNDGPIIRAIEINGDFCAIEGSHLPNLKAHWDRIKSILPRYVYDGEVRRCDAGDCRGSHNDPFIMMKWTSLSTRSQRMAEDRTWQYGRSSQCQKKTFQKFGDDHMAHRRTA